MFRSAFRIAFVLGGLAAACSSKKPSGPPESPGAVACTMDAKICPDGSAVGRTGPNCEFALCVAAAAPPSEPAPDATP
jgi:hypothetical protein